MKRKKHNMRNLKIWKRALEIAYSVSDMIESFPRNERYGLTSQMSRSSVSIPSNIAEGSSRTEKSFRHYIDIALGSSYELYTQILIAHRKNYISNDELLLLENEIVEWQRMAAGFQKSL